MKSLTDKDMKLYRFIYESTRDKGYQPSCAEMMRHMEINSTSSVERYITNLIQNEWIDLAKKQCRGLKLLRKPDGSPFNGFSDKESPDLRIFPEPLNDEQNQIFTFLYEFTKRQGFQISCPDLAKKLGTTTRIIQHRIYSIRKKGWFRWTCNGYCCLPFVYRPDSLPFTGFADDFNQSSDSTKNRKAPTPYLGKPDGSHQT